MHPKYTLSFIVGGSSGIGLALAQQLAISGTKVCIFARNEQLLAEAKSTIISKAKNAQACEYYPVDASDYDALKKSFELALSAHGTPDLVINCAGRSIPDYFLNITATQMQQTFQSNFQTAWNACHILIPYLKTNGATIVNTSSVGGLISVFGFTDYSASKFAIIGFSEALNQEMKKHNIKVQVLCPPDTDTPGFENENKTKPIETAKISEAAKLLKPETVAAECIKKLGKNQFLIIPGTESKVSWWLKQHFPGLVNKMIGNTIQQAHTTKTKKALFTTILVSVLPSLPFSSQTAN